LTYKNYSVLAEDGDSGAPSRDRGVQFPCYPYIPFDGARADSAILMVWLSKTSERVRSGTDSAGTARAPPTDQRPCL